MSTEKKESLIKQGKALRTARKAAGYRKLKDLAAEVGCTPGNLSSIERGDWGPSGSLRDNIVRKIGDTWLTREESAQYKHDAEAVAVTDERGFYIDPRRRKLIEDVKKLMMFADEETVEALEKNVQAFSRIPPKKKEE